MIKQADKSDIKYIENILLDAVKWMKIKKIPNQWTENSIRWECLSKEYKIDEFYINYQNGEYAGCVALTDYDNKYWPEIAKGESLFIHKLAVKRTFAGKGISKELIDFAKNLSLKKGCNSIRLDCNFKRDKLRTLYEKQGFKYKDKINLNNKCDMALYVWNR